MSSLPRIANSEQRARLVARHHLRRDASAVADAVRGLTAVHSTDPCTPYLSLRARLPDFSIADFEHALTADRTLWRMHAMRRTLFIVAADEGPIFLSGAGEAIAEQERRRLVGWLASGMPERHIDAFLSKMWMDVMEALDGGGEMRTQEIALAVPALSTEVTLGSGKWATRTAIGSRILLQMAMEGHIVRTGAAGSWRSSQYRWAATARWFGTGPVLGDAAEARCAIIRRYLERFGPATREDIRWWTGWPARDVDASLAMLEAVRVRLDNDSEGFVLPDDLGGVEAEAEENVALLPALDATPMGWKRREWYLGAHSGPLFDRNGNIGPTIWVGGRIVGGWGQRNSGAVATRTLEPLDPSSSARIAREAERLQEWLAGAVVTPRFRTPLEKELSSS